MRVIRTLSTLNGRELARSPGFSRRMERLYCKCELLNDAGADLGRAIESLRACRDAARSEDLAALEVVAAGLRRDSDVLQARLKRMEALMGRA